MQVTKEHLLIPDFFGKIGWGVVVLLSVFIPFQNAIGSQFNLPHQYMWLDEIFVVTTFLVVLLAVLFGKKMRREIVYIAMILGLPCLVGLVSGLYNANPWLVTANGILDYVKNFLIIPALFLAAVSERRIVSLYKILHYLALLLCIVAIWQETAFLLGLPVWALGVAKTTVRFGLLRTPSLMGHPNVFGLYALLFFVLDFSLHRCLRWQSLLLLSAVFLSVSRMVWVASFVCSLLLLIHGKGKVAKIMLVVMVGLVIFATPLFLLSATGELGSELSFRGYALGKSLQVWADHPVIGVGPGMYGGVISVLFDSPVYREYDFSHYWFRTYVSKIRSLDQFWPQILAEMGLAGTVSFGFVLLGLWWITRKASTATRSPFPKGILSGLSIVPLIIGIYLFGSGLNLTGFLLTYSILLGLCLGMRNENSSS